jgi:integrase
MSRKAAEAERDRILEPINAGVEIRPSSMMTLSEFIDTRYLEVKNLVWRADSTAATSLGILNNHLKAPLGRKLIHLVSRKDLQDLLIQKANADCSYSLVQHIHSFMTEIFEMALADGLIRLNPALSTVIPPCKAPKAKPILTPEEIKLAEKSMDIRERLVFRLDTTEGLRPSEWSGLQVGDTEPDRIHIRRRNYRFHINNPNQSFALRSHFARGVRHKPRGYNAAFWKTAE